MVMASRGTLRRHAGSGCLPEAYRGRQLRPRHRWTPSTPKRLTEEAAKRFVRRSSARVAIERTPPDIYEIEWLDPATQKEYWDRHITGHVNDGTARCTPDEQGLTYHVSSWRDQQGNRMILISEIC